MLHTQRDLDYTDIKSINVNKCWYWYGKSSYITDAGKHNQMIALSNY